MIEDDIKPGQEYLHFKGGRYVVDAVAVDANTLERVVSYHSTTLAEGRCWCRPVCNFLQRVDTPTGEVQRFTLIEPVGESDSRG